VLQAIGDDAHESNAQSDGRVPPLVHDAIEIGIGHLPHKPDRHFVNGIVVVAQGLRVAGDEGDLVGLWP